MKERRSLVEGVQAKPIEERTAEEAFVYGSKSQMPNAPNVSAPVTPVAKPSPQAGRVPFTTRVRSDIAHALKRASLERQLQSVEPNTVQEILEDALEPWLKTNGYLP